MDELVYLRNDEAVCSSLQVAEKFEKRHDNVMRSIEGLLKNEETHEMFKNSSYIEEQNNQRYPMYLMNRDGFSLLVMGFTGKKALDWKLQYIKAFNQMEKFIREKQTQTWIETRKAGKLTRKAETDTIKNLVEYAKGQGSQHADKLYMTYSKLANKMAGISKRDEATKQRLRFLLGGLEPPEEMNYIILDVSIIRFNRIGSEGLSSHSVEGESLSWSENDFAGYMDDIRAYLDDQKESKKGKVRFL